MSVVGAVDGEFRDLVFPDRFEVRRVLGRGGSSAVFAAFDTRLRRQVAVKVLRVGAGTEEVLARHEEARVVASLNHPHLVAVFDTFLIRSRQQQPTAMLVLEYVDGPDLHQYLRTATMPIEQAVQVGVQLCGALAYVHEQGFLHQDVKPSNVLLTFPSGEVTAKLSDFGTAAVLQGQVEQGEFTIGTAAYLSPEQADGSTLTAASDVYALGLVLLEAVTGEVAFPGSVLEAAMARLDVDPPIPDELPVELREVLTGMTQRSPRARMGLRQAQQRLRALQRRLEQPAPAEAAASPAAPPLSAGRHSAGAPQAAIGGETAQFFRPQEEELTRLLELAVLLVDGAGAALLGQDGGRLQHRATLGLDEQETLELRRALLQQLEDGVAVHVQDDARFVVAAVPGDDVRYLVVALSERSRLAEGGLGRVEAVAKVAASALALRDSFRRALFAR